MSLDKAIKSGKEKRNPFRRSKAFDKTCRCHGGCPWCVSDKLYQHNKELERTKDEIKNYDR